MTQIEPSAARMDPWWRASLGAAKRHLAHVCVGGVENWVGRVGEGRLERRMSYLDNKEERRGIGTRRWWSKVIGRVGGVKSGNCVVSQAQEEAGIWRLQRISER